MEAVGGGGGERGWRWGKRRPSGARRSPGWRLPGPSLSLSTRRTLPPTTTLPRTYRRHAAAAPSPAAAYLSSEVQSLVKGLLQKDASKRLGYGPSGSADVMGHPFFKSVDWRKLEGRQVGAPGWLAGWVRDELRSAQGVFVEGRESGRQGERRAPPLPRPAASSPRPCALPSASSSPLPLPAPCKPCRSSPPSSHPSNPSSL